MDTVEYTWEGEVKDKQEEADQVPNVTDEMPNLSNQDQVPNVTDQVPNVGWARVWSSAHRRGQVYDQVPNDEAFVPQRHTSLTNSG